MSTETMKADADDTNPYLLHNMSRCEWPPDWRFRRARYRFFDEVPRDAGVDDELIDAAVKVLKAHEYKGRRGTDLLRKSCPEIVAAFDLYEQRSHKHMRNLIEAALISCVERMEPRNPRAPKAKGPAQRGRNASCASITSFLIRSYGTSGTPQRPRAPHGEEGRGGEAVRKG